MKNWCERNSWWMALFSLLLSIVAFMWAVAVGLFPSDFATYGTSLKTTAATVKENWLKVAVTIIIVLLSLNLFLTIKQKKSDPTH